MTFVLSGGLSVRREVRRRRTGYTQSCASTSLAYRLVPLSANNLQRPREHEAEDRHDHTQMQKQITAGDQVQPKDERQNKIDDH